MIRRHVAVRSVLLLTLCMLASGCSLVFGETSGDAPALPADTTEPSPAAGTEGEGSAVEEQEPASAAPGDETGDLFELLGPEDRIVVQTRDQGLSVLTFAGQVFVEADGPATQPVFSPDGSALAWTSLNPTRTAGSVVFADVAEDGSIGDQTRVETPVVSFYTSWAPGSSDRLAVLGNSRGGVGVAIVEVSGESTAVVDAGVPYYYVWNRAGDGLIGHVGNQLRSFDLSSGTGRNLFDVNNSFRTPAVLGDESAAYVGVENSLPFPGGNAVAKVEAGDSGELGDGRVSVIGRYDGSGTLALSPDSTKVAVVVEGTLETTQIFSASTHAAGFVPSVGLDRGLHIIDVATDEVTTIVSEPVRVAYWSPDSELIVSLTYESLGDGVPWSRWTVHDAAGREISRTPRFALSREFGDVYLPFFDQYAQSVTLWSPDSTRFVFPGMSVDETTGIWLHHVPDRGGEGTTQWIADGVVAFWSPVDDG
jgi:Tol biopolymer transport system component